VTSALPPPPDRPIPPPPTSPGSPTKLRLHPGVFIGAGLVLLGVIAGSLWFASRMPGISNEIDRLQRSNTRLPLEFEIEEAVEWTIFVEPSNVSLSGVRYAIVDLVTGEEVPVSSAGNTRYAWFGRSGRSIGKVEIPAGSYRLPVEGSATVALGSDPTSKIGWAFGGAALIGVPLVAIGLAVAIVSAVRDTRRRAQNAEPGPPSPWSAGEWPADPGR
jgi:hypothetical protein